MRFPPNCRFTIVDLRLRFEQRPAQSTIDSRRAGRQSTIRLHWGLRR